VLPPPNISRSALTGRGRDALVGQMLPQPEVSAADGAAPLDRWLGCHQWLALGIGVDPAAALSRRDRAILDRLGARLASINGRADVASLHLTCGDQSFLDWAKRNRVSGVLVRPDRFIAERLDPRANLQSLDPFAGATGVASPAPIGAELDIPTTAG
jgi:3-(3-hydroxy-phenyl)propionate hydroxylase